MNLLENYSLLPHNTFGMDVYARYFAEYDTVEELADFLQTDLARSHKLLPIGAGSNLLFTGDYDGIVLHSRIRFCTIVGDTPDEVLVRVGSGVVWDDFCADMCARGFGGIENLSYIPGEIGASAVQNIGAYGVEAKDVIVCVETIETATGQAHTFDAAACDYGYRHSIFKSELQGRHIVTAVTYRLQKKPTLRLDYGNLRDTLSHIAHPTVADVRRAVIDIRRQKLPEPTELGSAGSFFKNPIIPSEHFLSILQQEQKTAAEIPHFETADGIKIPAAWLIEQCGWKGKRQGGAQVYEKQPLVIVNTGNATAQDIITLAADITESIEQRFQITLHPEVNYI